MAQMTLDEAYTQLNTVNAAIEALIAGKRLKQLRIGSGSFSRLYDFTEITLENLKAHRNEILDIIDILEDTPPSFKKNVNIPMIVGKDL